MKAYGTIFDVYNLLGRSTSVQHPRDQKVPTAIASSFGGPNAGISSPPHHLAPPHKSKKNCSSTPV